MKNYFQFACELEPIDRFPGCMSKDDLLENLLRQDTQAGFLLPEKRTETALRVMQLEQEAEQRTCEISGGWFPRRVLVFAVPPVDGKACQLCALTQIESPAAISPFTGIISNPPARRCSRRSCGTRTRISMQSMKPCCSIRCMKADHIAFSPC